MKPIFYMILPVIAFSIIFVNTFLVIFLDELKSWTTKITINLYEN